MSAVSVAAVQTDKAARYMSQLVKHFAHKAQTKLDDNAGEIAFTGGACKLEVWPETLVMSVEARSGEDLSRLEDVIVRHLQRFAFREPLQVAWVRD
jgi:hypothetical protein